MIITRDGTPYTVLPFLANWDAMRPKFRLTWDTEIEQSLRGYEARGSYRKHPRPRLSYAVDMTNAGELVNLLRRTFHVDHATAHLPDATAGTSRVAVPWVGRESFIQAWTSTTITIDPTPHTWAVNDWLIVWGEFTGYVVASVADLAGSTLTLSTSIAVLGLSDGCMVHPLFFGRMDAPDIDLQSSLDGDVPFVVTGERYMIAPGIPPACLDEPEWPDPPTAVGPTAAATATVMEMSASFDGAASTPGTHPKDGVTVVPLTGYLWDFGDGGSAVGVAPEHEFAAAGVYNVVLTVTDGLLRFDPVVVTVTIAEPADPYGSGGELGGGGI